MSATAGSGCFASELVMPRRSHSQAASSRWFAAERSAAIAAQEARAAGVAWTFAPMVDVARDPRWGRMSEGAGEDVYLGSKIAVARVRGFPRS